MNRGNGAAHGEIRTPASGLGRSGVPTGWWLPGIRVRRADTKTGGGDAGAKEDSADFPAFWRALVVLVLALLALPIVAHGCHTGDHDDEPAFLPPAHCPEPPGEF